MNLSFYQQEVVRISMEWKHANDDSILDVNKIMQDFSSLNVSDSDDNDDQDHNNEEITSDNKSDSTTELKKQCTSGLKKTEEKSSDKE